LSLKTRSDGQAREAFTFLDEWRNSINYVEAYALLSERYARELNVKQILQDKKLDELFGNDLFKEVDRIIVHKLTEMAVSGTLNAQEALQRITERKGSYWVKSDTERKVMRFYDCLASYFRFQQEIGSLEEYPSDIRAFWDLYSRSYYRVDTEYRLFIEQLLEISQRELLTPLLDKIEKVYVNTYLSGLSAAWHEVLTDFSVFSTGDFPRQADFFKRYVQPYLQQGKIVFVILSDALRYDIGAELAGLLERQNRVQVELEPIAACVPTYTQIGMAALLPHRSLGLDPKSGNAVIDGKKVAGLEGRNTVLEDYAKKAGNGLKAKAIDARAFMDISPVQQEEEIRGFGCVYLYSNHIDAIGDSAKTELSLPDAARREIEFLCSLVKKITNLNRTHILITADHGFLYQYGAVEESDFIAVQESAGELRRDRRFLLGTHLPDDPRLLGVTAEQAGLAGDFEISLVKGVSRIRKSGGGSRYVHGGASLHEICIPLLKIRKVREDDLRPVHFVVLTRVTDITTNSISLKFLQVDPVGAKVLPRHIAARFESDDGKTVLSNQRDLVFESSDENEQNRTLSADFVFNGDASKFNGKIVHLAFFENKMGVTVPVEERKAFRFRTAFTPDF
jgi:uncharacterized protein (TIGR02687 family)